MAQIGALDLVLKGTLKSKSLVYTFGQPRVGNAAFVQLYNSMLPYSFRITNNRDIVPHVPPCDPKLLHKLTTLAVTGAWSWQKVVTTLGSKMLSANKECRQHAGWSLYHAGIEIWFGSGDYQDSVMCGYVECTGYPKGEDVACANGLKMLSINDHDMQSSSKGYGKVLVRGFCNTPTKWPAPTKHTSSSSSSILLQKPPPNVLKSLPPQMNQQLLMMHNAIQEEL